VRAAPLPGIDHAYRAALAPRATERERRAIQHWMRDHARAGAEDPAWLCPFDVPDHPNASGYCDGSCCDEGGNDE
jgi:hypothetical protein